VNAVNRGNAVLAKSITPSRIEENNKLLKLDDEDMEALDNIHKEKGTKRYLEPPRPSNLNWRANPNIRFITPPWPVNFGFPDWKQDV